jgi:hypothetical protein
MSRKPRNHKPAEARLDAQALEQRIRERAYELFVESGSEHGHDALHWLQAEREICDEQDLPIKHDGPSQR